MSQTSTERLRDYLAQLPPQAQALLMREFERAIERGEDVVVANFVLEQLRKVVRGTEEDDEARPRTDDPARLLYGPLEPFLVEGSFPVRAGQIRRASLLPVWQWLSRDAAPEAARGGPLAAVRDGDPITIDVPARRLAVALTDAEIARRMEGWAPPENGFTTGVFARYRALVGSASEGAVLAAGSG